MILHIKSPVEQSIVDAVKCASVDQHHRSNQPACKECLDRYKIIDDYSNVLFESLNGEEDAKSKSSWSNG